MPEKTKTSSKESSERITPGVVLDKYRKGDLEGALADAKRRYISVYELTFGLGLLFGYEMKDAYDIARFLKGRKGAPTQKEVSAIESKYQESHLRHIFGE